MVINLRVGGKQCRFYVHRLILEAFVGPCPDGLECLHHDGNPANNWIGNLSWGTHVKNVDDSRRHETCQMGHLGEKNGQAKLMEADIPVIRRLASEGVVYHDIAARFGTTTPNVCYIVNRKSWAHIA